MNGLKYDKDKLRYDLLPAVALEQIVSVLTFGAKKYAPENWRKVDDAHSRYFAAAQRHLWAWQKGELNDKETGESHLAHAACCLMFLAEIEREGVCQQVKAVNQGQ